MFGRKNRKLKTVIEYNEITIRNQKLEIEKLTRSNALKESKIKDLVNSNQSKDRFIDEQKNDINKVQLLNKHLRLSFEDTNKTKLVDFGNFLFRRVNKKTSPVKFVVTDADLCNFLDKK